MSASCQTGDSPDIAPRDAMIAAGAGSLQARRLRPVRASAGFTLIELTVVLAILALASALALPNLQRLHGSIVQRTQSHALLDQIAGLGARALLDGQDYVVWPSAPESMSLGDDYLDRVAEAATPWSLGVASGWRYQLDRPLLALASGVCLGAVLEIEDPAGRRQAHTLSAPLCQASAAARPGPQ